MATVDGNLFNPLKGTRIAPIECQYAPIDRFGRIELAARAQRIGLGQVIVNGSRLVVDQGGLDLGIARLFASGLFQSGDAFIPPSITDCCNTIEK
ncbi:hypothetical protein [Dechloromonas denitrificans]|uniref:hypothetical protein n=1 Tax=Dechloromonas denitrificans TaxID=281362 RepID=UPI001F0A104F|nr:hypothetical protein [Dechloromonas denitrificans]